MCCIISWMLIKTISSCSWGPDDDGHTVDGPHPLGKVSLLAALLLSSRWQKTATDLCIILCSSFTRFMFFSLALKLDTYVKNIKSAFYFF